MSRFEALGMQQDATQEIDAPELDVDFLDFRQLKQEVAVQISEKPLDPIPQTLSLLAVSNKFGYFVASTSNGILYGQLAALRQTFASSDTHSLAKFASNHTIPVQPGHNVQFVKISASQLTIIVATTRGMFAFYNAKDVSNGNYTPSATIDLSEEIKDVQPNPGDNVNMVAVLITLGLVKIISIDGQGLSQFGHEISSICWSARGKQIACGTGAGQILQFTPDGQLKNEIPRPPSLQGQYYAADLQWLENTVFLCVYNLPPEGGEPNHSYEVYILTRQNNASPWTHVKISDPVPAFGLMDRTGFRHIFNLKNFQPYKHLLVMGNGPSADLGLVGNQPDAPDLANSGGWLTAMPPETSRMTLGVSKFAEGSDVCPVGLAVDLTASPGELNVPGEEGEPSKYPDRAPIVLTYTNDGIVLAWWVCQTRIPRQPYSDMVMPIGFDDTEESMGIDITPAAPVSAPAPAATFGSSVGGIPALPKISSLPAFGQSTFGQQSQPAFGQTGFGSTSRSSFGAPAFGQTAAPTFGSTSSLGSNQPVFGSRSSMGISQPTFGSTSALGSSTFGNAASKPTFGSTSAIGSNPTPTFGSTTPLGSANKSIFGSNTTSKGFSGFATASNDTSPFAQQQPSNVSSPFASTAPTQSPFPSTSNASPFGQSSVAATSSFPFAASLQNSSTTPTSALGAPKFSMSHGAFGGMRDASKNAGSDEEVSAAPIVMEAKDDEMSDGDSDEAPPASWAADDDPVTQQFNKKLSDMMPPAVVSEGVTKDGSFAFGKLGLSESSKPASVSTRPIPSKPEASSSSSELSKAEPTPSQPVFSSQTVGSAKDDIPKGFFSSQAAVTAPLKSPALTAPHVGEPRIPSPALSTGSKNFPFGNIDSVDKPIGGSMTNKSTPTLQQPKSSVETTSKSIEPVPASERKSSALEMQFMNIYLVMRDELEALGQKTKQSARSLREAGTPSERLKAMEDFANPSNWTFGDIPLLISLTQQLVQDSKTSSDVAQELKKSVKSLQAELLKGEAKRSEIDRYLRAKVDAGFETLVKERPLGPEQLENQQRLNVSSRLVNQRLEHLEENIRILRSRSVALKKNEAPAFKAPSLDTIKRAIRNISTGVQEQTNAIDDMLTELNTLRLGNTPPAHRRSPFLASRSNGSRNGQRSLSDTLKVSKLNAVHTEVTVDVAKVAAASLNKERFGQMLKAVWEAEDIKVPIINNLAVERIHPYNSGKEDSIPPLDIKIARPLIEVQMQQSPKVRKPTKRVEVATPSQDHVKIESPPPAPIPVVQRKSAMSPSPSPFAASNDVPMPTRSIFTAKPSQVSPMADGSRESMEKEKPSMPTQPVPPPVQQVSGISSSDAEQLSSSASEGSEPDPEEDETVSSPLVKAEIPPVAVTQEIPKLPVAIPEPTPSTENGTSLSFDVSKMEIKDDVQDDIEKESEQEEDVEEDEVEENEEEVEEEEQREEDEEVEQVGKEGAEPEAKQQEEVNPEPGVDEEREHEDVKQEDFATKSEENDTKDKAVKEEPADSMLQKGGLWSFKPTPAPTPPVGGGLLSFKATAAPLQPAGSDFKFDFGNLAPAPKLTEASHDFAPFSPFVPAAPVDKVNAEGEHHRSAGAVRRQLRANRGKQTAFARDDSAAAAPSFGIIDFSGQDGREDEEWEDEEEVEDAGDNQEDGDEDEDENEQEYDNEHDDEHEYDEEQGYDDEQEYDNERDEDYQPEEGEEIDDQEEHILSPVDEEDEEEEE